MVFFQSSPTHPFSSIGHSSLALFFSETSNNSHCELQGDLSVGPTFRNLYILTSPQTTVQICHRQQQHGKAEDETLENQISIKHIQNRCIIVIYNLYGVTIIDKLIDLQSLRTFRKLCILTSTQTIV